MSSDPRIARLSELARATDAASIAEERIKRLTELARRVWPDEPRLVVDYEAQYLTASVLDSPWDNPDLSTLLKIERHPRTLDALEAALRVLAGEPPAWVEQLAERWEQRGQQQPVGLASRLVQECADELRGLLKDQDR